MGKTKSNEEKLLKSMNFSDTNEELKNLSEKYFKYWLMESLKGEGIDVDSVSYNHNDLIGDFKKELAEVVMLLWDPEDDPRKNDLRFMKGALGGGLDRTWNDRYLVPLGKETEQKLSFYFPMSTCLSNTIFIKFIDQNKNKFPIKKKQRRNIIFSIKILSHKIKFFLQNGEWPWWVR